jgi:xanthine dehydrogenase iron-sulfur cluster and FAD-binding subunit A
VREGMSGNLCRCGAYAGITDAVLDAQKALSERDREALGERDREALSERDREALSERDREALSEPAGEHAA